MRPNNPDIGEDGLRELREIRLRRGLSQADLSAKTGVAEFTISEIESGKRANPRPSTLRKLAQALGVDVADLYGGPDSPLAQASAAEQRSFDNHIREEQRSEWDAAADRARQLRKRGRSRMETLLSAWRESKARGEPSTARRALLDEMGDLLQRAYDAETALQQNFPEEMTPRAREAAEQAGGEWTPDPEWEEVREASRFYGALLEMVQGAGFLHVRREAKPHVVENAA